MNVDEIILAAFARVEKIVKTEKLFTAIFSFFHYVFKRLLFQGGLKLGLCCKELKVVENYSLTKK